MAVFRRLIRQALVREAGFTLAELLIAITLLTIGIVGAGAVIIVQSGGLSGGSSVGLAAVTRGNYVSRASMLAQERIELIRNTALANPGNIAAIDAFNGQTETPVANYTRVTTVAAGPTTDTRQVTVAMTFRPPTESGLGQQETIQLVTIIAERP